MKTEDEARAVLERNLAELAKLIAEGQALRDALAAPRHSQAAPSAAAFEPVADPRLVAAQASMDSKFRWAIESSHPEALAPSVHQALLDSLSGLLDRQREMQRDKRLTLDERESVDAAIALLAKLPRATP